MAYTLIDLFAGCGGLTAGFVATNEFEPIFAVENDRDAAETYEMNFGGHLARYDDGVPMKIEDVREGIPKADVVVGGPPCQGFSPLNMLRVDLGRRNLWQEYEEILDSAEADVFLMENVPELLRSGEFKLFLTELDARDRGWQVRAEVLNAANVGVPQTRRRAIVIGSRLGEPPWPELSHYPPNKIPLGKESWKTFRDAVKGLPLKPNSKNWHNPRNPRPMSLERYMTIPNQGEGRFDLAARRPDITPACWLRKKTGSTDVFGRLWWDKPAFTIRTEFYKPEKGRYLHPSEHRPITVREAARCQTFDDDFIFPAHQSMTSVAKQIGNAVPPLLGQRIAEALAEHLRAFQLSGDAPAAVAA